MIKKNFFIFKKMDVKYEYENYFRNELQRLRKIYPLIDTEMAIMRINYFFLKYSNLILDFNDLFINEYIDKCFELDHTIKYKVALEKATNRLNEIYGHCSLTEEEIIEYNDIKENFSDVDNTMAKMIAKFTLNKKFYNTDIEKYIIMEIFRIFNNNETIVYDVAIKKTIKNYLFEYNKKIKKNNYCEFITNEIYKYKNMYPNIDENIAKLFAKKNYKIINGRSIKYELNLIINSINEQFEKDNNITYQEALNIAQKELNINETQVNICL